MININKSIFNFILISIFVLTFISTGYAMEYNEAPLLKEMVEKGELPSVEERLPEEPMIVEPYKDVGRYGGTIYTATNAPDNPWGAAYSVLNFSGGIMLTSDDYMPTIPDLLKSYELSDDGKEFTMRLRKGIKWSDGEPFTTDDIVYQIEHELKNEELTPNPFGILSMDGEVLEYEQIDDYTIKFHFPSKNPGFSIEMGTYSGLVHNWASPEHYMKQFHPDFIGEEKAEEKAEEAGYDNWYDYYGELEATFYSNQTEMNDGPVLMPYVLVEKTDTQFVYERNPYYWRVDSEGNQLPYIDRVVCTIAGDKEVINGMAMSGELDLVSGFTDITRMPLYQRMKDKADFRILEWKLGVSNIMVIEPNHTIKDDPKIEELFNDVRFKRALSLTIDRETINQQLFFGIGEPMQYTVLESTPWFKQEYAEAYIDYNPEKAEELLKDIGLKKNDQGNWAYPNGEEINWTIEYEQRELPHTEMLEIIVQDWKDFGLDVSFKQIDASLRQTRQPAGSMEMTVWGGGYATTVRFATDPNFFVPARAASNIWPFWEQWYVTNGEEGEEPPQKAKDLLEWYENMMASMTWDERVKWGRKILESQAENLWTIGTIGKLIQPILVNNDLKNVPEEGLFDSGVRWMRPQHPEQFYFESRPVIDYSESSLPGLYTNK